MPETDTGVTDQVAAGQTGETTQVAAGDTGVTGQATADSTGAEAQAAAENMIPKARLEQETEKLRVAQAEAEVLRQQIAIVNANPPQQQQAQQVQQPQSNFEKAVIDCGLQDAEYLTVQQQAQVSARAGQYDAATQSQQVQNIMDNQFAAQNADFAATVGSRNGAGQFVPSAEYSRVYNSQPHLQASMQTAEGAYRVIKDQQNLATMNAQAKTAAQQEAAQKVDAATAPMSPAAAGGPGVITKPGNFSRADQEAMDARVAAGEFD